MALALGLDPMAYLEAEPFKLAILQAVIRQANDIRVQEHTGLAKAFGHEVGVVLAQVFKG